MHSLLVIEYRLKCGLRDFSCIAISQCMELVHPIIILYHFEHILAMELVFVVYKDRRHSIWKHIIVQSTGKITARETEREREKFIFGFQAILDYKLYSKRRSLLVQDMPISRSHSSGGYVAMQTNWLSATNWLSTSCEIMCAHWVVVAM